LIRNFSKISRNFFFRLFCIRYDYFQKKISHIWYPPNFFGKKKVNFVFLAFRINLEEKETFFFPRRILLAKHFSGNYPIFWFLFFNCPLFFCVRLWYFWEYFVFLKSIEVIIIWIFFIILLPNKKFKFSCFFLFFLSQVLCLISWQFCLDILLKMFAYLRYRSLQWHLLQFTKKKYIFSRKIVFYRSVLLLIIAVFCKKKWPRLISL